ncbi:MAG: TRAP transporter small permease [Rhizobiaceae bacterium]|nr:TRAP transporter small permease [Rhizobiaceae bacterium]
MAPMDGRSQERSGRQPALAGFAKSAMSWLHTLLGLTLLFVVAINVVNATSRYLFGFSPVGADELMVYLVIWAVMIAAIVSLILRAHINVNLLPLYTKGRVRHLLHVIHSAAAVFACGYATYSAWLFVARISQLGVKSMGLGLPMTIPHAALLIGFAGLTVTGAAMLIRDGLALIRNTPHTEVGS